MNQVTFAFGLGNRVRDIGTGFAGVVTALAIYRDGNKYCAVTAMAKDDGTAPVTNWISENFLREQT